MNNKSTLLIVDNVPANIHLLASYLQDQYHIKIATSGIQCLKLANAKNKPALILLDIQMPIMDGYEVCRRLKSNPSTQFIPVIFITSNISVENEQLGFLLGAADYITKPIQPAIVAARIKTHILLEQQRNMLADQKTRLQAILDHAPFLVSTKDLEGHITLVNKQFELLEGPPLNEYIGKNNYDILPNDAATSSRNSDLAAHSELTEIQETIKHRDGTKRTYLTTKFPISNASGTLTSIGVISVDITERKQTEDKLRHISKMEAISQLTGGIAHDFNNLLAIVMGNNEMAQTTLAEGDTDNTEEHLNQVHKSCIRAKNLVTQLLAFSHGEKEKFEALLVSPLIQEIWTSLNTIIPPSIQIKILQDDINILIEMKAEYLSRMIINLCINAYDAIGEKGHITIRTLRKNNVIAKCSSCYQDITGDYIQITIRDNGAGIPEERINRIFDPLYTTKALSTSDGTGMGLSIVHSLIHSQGGHITVNSEVQKGTTFTLMFPVC